MMINTTFDFQTRDLDNDIRYGDKTGSDYNVDMNKFKMLNIP